MTGGPALAYACEECFASAPAKAPVFAHCDSQRTAGDDACVSSKAEVDCMGEFPGRVSKIFSIQTARSVHFLGLVWY